MVKTNLPKGCNYPDCFNCELEDCILPDDMDLLGDSGIDQAVEELQREREKLLADLKAKGVSSRDSAEYHHLSSKIHYLKNRDERRLQNKRRYESRQKCP